MNETNALLRDILDALKTQPVEVVNSPVKTFNSLTPGKTLVAVPSKMELCRQWLHDHPEDMALTVRELSTLRQPMGVQISHVTWSQAKKDIGLV